MIGTTNEKTRVEWIVKELRDITAGKSILDAGAGEMPYKEYCGHLKYLSQDFGKYDGKGDQKGLQTKKWDNSGLDIVCDITSIPTIDKSFDAVLCTEVFEHLPNPIGAIAEFSRILKKRGRLILTAPFCSLTHFAPYHFSSGYNKYYYQRVLRDYGFNIVKIDNNGNYFEYMAQELWRLPEIVRNYTSIPKIFTYVIYILNIIMIGLLAWINKKNKGSEDLLCFGYQVVAEKK